MDERLSKRVEWILKSNDFSLIRKGDLDFSQDVGIRIHGYGGRITQIKSFNVYGGKVK